MFPPQYIGKYFYGDYSSGFFRTIDPTGTPPLSATPFATGASGPLGFDVSPIDGSLYYIEYNARTVKRIFVNSSSAPSIQDQPQNATVSIDEPVTFTVAASGPSLSYQWQRNGVNIPVRATRWHRRSSPTTGRNSG
jgi:hypothetical protein